MEPSPLAALVNEPWVYLTVFVFGTLWGSFANVCIYRWPPSPEHPKGRSVVWPGSHCGACKKPVRWYDNVPILSYLWLRGHCRDCGVGFSPRYLFVEAATGMLFVAAWHLSVVYGVVAEPELTPRLIEFAVMAAFIFTMVVITFIDLDHQLILNRVTFPAIPIFFGLGLVLGRDWRSGLFGAALGYGIVRLVSDGYYWLTKREGLGYGDGKLLAIIGALLGWRAVVFSLFGGSLAGSLIGVAALALRRRHGAPTDDNGEEVALRHQALPFGPFLAAAAIIYLLAEPWIVVHVGLFAL